MSEARDGGAGIVGSLAGGIADATREVFQHVFGRGLDTGDGYFRKGTLSEHDRVDLSEA